MVGFAQPTLTGRYSARSALLTLLCSVVAYSLTSGKGIGPTTRGCVLVAQAFTTQTNPQTATALLKPKLIPPVNNALTKATVAGQNRGVIVAAGQAPTIPV